MVRLGDVATVLRSKNAGPFLTTFDVFFPDRESFEAARSSPVFTREGFAALYRIAVDDVLGVHAVEAALGLKVTIRKAIPHDHPSCTDVMGAHQHFLLADVEVGPPGPPGGPGSAG
jgi:hypothetical protein